MATRPAPRYAKDPVALAKLRRERAFSSPAPKVKVKAKPMSYNRFGSNRIPDRKLDTPTRVFGEVAKAVLPDPATLKRAAMDPGGTIKGAAEIASLAQPSSYVARASNLIQGKGLSLYGADMSDVEQALEVAGLIPTGKAATLPAKFGIDLLDLGIRGAARRASPDMLSAASGGIVRGAPKPVRQARKRVATPEDVNQAGWGDPMGAPRGTGERRLNPEGRRGTPRFYRGQQGVGKAEFTPEQLGYTPESYADEFNMSVDEARKEMKTLGEMSTESYRSNRGIGDAPIIVSVEKLATPETMKEVISKSSKRYGNLTDKQIEEVTTNINKDIMNSPGAVFRMRDIEDRLIAYTAIHHGETPFWIGGAGKPEEWSGIPNRLNSFFGARGK